MSTPRSSDSDPTVTAAEELRWRLGALVSRHGDRVARDAEIWRACELDLSALYSGPYAVRAYAVVQALKHGLVADLVSWHAEGARQVDGEIAQRLTERSGVSRPIADWAIAQWAFAFRLDAGGPVETAAAPLVATAHAPFESDVVSPAPSAPAPIIPEVREPVRRGMELTIGVPQLVGAGALVALTLASLLGPRVVAMPRVAALLGDPIEVAPPLPPAPALEGAPLRVRELAVARDTMVPSPARGCSTDGSAPSQPPRLVRDPRPRVPRALREAGIERGTVVLRFRVDAEGRVDSRSVEVLEATDDRFTRSALEVLPDLRYRPARRDGCTIDATVTKALRFSSR